MGRKIKFPLRNLFYWSVFCVAFFLILTPEVKAGFFSDVSNTVGNTMGSVGAAFESTVKQGENNIVGLVNATQETVKEKIGKIGEKTAAPARASQKEDTLKAKTVEKKVTVKNQKKYSIFQAGLDKIKDISKEVIDAGKDLGGTFVDGAKDFSATIDSAVESVAATVESGVKKSGKKAIELVDVAQEKIGVVSQKTQTLVSDIFGSTQKTADKPAVTTQKPISTKKPVTGSTAPAPDTAKDTSKTPTAPTKPDTAPKPQLTVYSNANNKKETVEQLIPQTKSAEKATTTNKNTGPVATKDLIAPEKDDTSSETTASETKTTNGITTLQNIKVLGTIDFTEAKVAGLQQTVVNNYSSGPSVVVYSEKNKQNESLTMISGAGGGVSRSFSVGENLSVGNSSDSTSGDITATRNITAGGNITVNGTGSFGSLTISSITNSGNSSVSGTLQVSNTTTLYNDLLVGAAAESISDPGFIFNGNDAYFHDKIGVNGIAYFDNTIQASSTLLVGTAAGTDNFFVNGNNTYVATSTAYGTAYSLVIGNGTTGAIVAGGHVSPSHTGLFDLGRNGLGWNNLYTSSTIYTGAGGTSLSTLTANNLAFAGSLGTVSSTAGNLRLAADGANQLQLWTNNSQRAFIDSSGNTFASGTLQATGSILTYGNVTSTGHIYPATVNTVDLGALNIAFRNIYASSSINVGASGTSSTFKGNYLALTNGTSSTVLNGSSLTLGSGTNYSSGMFNVDSNGNVSASGTLNLPNTAVTSTIAGGLTVDTNSLVVNYSNGRIGIGTTGPMATVHVGNGTTNSSVDSQILISRLVDDTISGNGHAFSDSSNISRGGTIGYNSYDARITISGSNGFDHYAGFQAAPTYAAGGTISNIYGFYSSPSLSTGAITNYYGVYTVNPSNTAALTNNYGVYVDNQTSGTNNWGIFISASGTASNIPLEIRQPTGTGSVTQILLNRSSANAGDQNLIKWKSSTLEGASIGMEVRSSSAADLVLSTNSAGTTNLTEKMRITSSGNVGVGTSTPYAKLAVWGGGIGAGQLFELTNSASSTMLKVLDNGTMTVSGSISPTSTSNLIDLGALNTAFRNIYASSSINVGSSANSSTFMGNYLALTNGTSSTVLNASSLTLGSGTAYNSGMFNIDSNGNMNASGTLLINGGASDSAGLQLGVSTRGISADASYMYFVIGGANAAYLSSGGTFYVNNLSAASGSSEAIYGYATNGATAIAVKVGNQNTLSTAGAKIMSFYTGAPASTPEKAFIDISGGYNSGNGTATSTFGANTITSGVATGFNLGKFYVDSSGNVSATGSLKTFANVTSSGHIYPATSNAVDLGALNTAFRNIYASSSINVGSSANSSTFMGNYLALTNGTSSTVLNGSSLTLGQGTSGYNSGMFNVNSNGNVSASGTISAPSGSVSAPSLTFVGDSDTGIYHTSNVLYFGTDGSNRAAINATAFSVNNIPIFEGTGYSLRLLGRPTDSSTAIAVKIGAVDGVTVAGSKIISFYSDNVTTERAYINASGTPTFGIQTGYNAGLYNIDTSGNVSASGTITAWGSQTASSSILNSSALTLGKGTNYNSGMFNVDSNGNVNASGTLILNSGNTTGNFFQIASTTNQNIFTVDSLGRVGIGTATFSTYDAGLIVQSARSKYSFHQMDSDGSNSIGFYLSSGGESTIEMYNAAGTLKNYFISNGSSYITGGNLGVGDETPLYLFTVGSGDKFGIDSSGNISASGSLKTFGNVTSTGHIYPAAVNTVDLGGLNIAFRNIYASSSINVGASGTSSTFKGNYLAMTDGTTSAVYQGGSLQFGQATNYLGGAVAINNKGNVSASGTLVIYGDEVGNYNVTGSNTTNLKIWIDQGTPAGQTASTTFTSNLFSTGPGIGLAGFVFNTKVNGGSMASTTGVVDKVLISVQNNSVPRFIVSAGGNVYAASSFIANSTDYGTGTGDVAEYVNLVEGATVDFGDVVVVDTNGLNQYHKSENAYAKNVAGVISDTGAFMIGGSGAGRAPLALAGLVNVKATDENGPIAVGDYLVSASKPGYAMKYDADSGKSAGLVGMALEPLAAGEGKIKILVNKGLVNGGGGTTELTVSEDEDGALSASSNLNMKGKSILNIAGLNKTGDLWYIDKTGLLVAKEIKADTVQAKKFVVEKKTDAKQTSVGEATILNNSTLVTVENELVTSTSKIFITFRSNPNSFWWISKQEEGMFEVSLSKLSETDLTFDYWIVGIAEPEEEDSDAEEELEEEPATEDITQNTDNTTQTTDETVDTQEETPLEIENPTEETTEPATEPTPEEVADTTLVTEDPIAEPEVSEPAPAAEETPTEPTIPPAENSNL